MTIETILWSDIGVRAAARVLALSPGDASVLRYQDPGKAIYLLDIFADFSTSADLFIHSPRMHDNVDGFHIDVTAALGPLNYLKGCKQKLFPQDNIQVVGGIGGDAATYDNAALSVFYEDLSGMSGNLFSWDSIKDRVKNVLTILVGADAAATGQWLLIDNLIALTDLTKANTSYAVLGMFKTIGNAILSISGPCTGNVRLGCPCFFDRHQESASYFIDLSIKSGLATIPVFNSSDKAATNLWSANSSLAAGACSIMLAELED